MSKLLRNISLLHGILIAVGAVLLVVLVPSIFLDIMEQRASIDAAAARQATAAVDMLEAVHVQAMLNRNRTADNDPAIDTLNGAMDQFSEVSQGVRLWVFMGPKVIDFQRAAGETEIEEPLDALDREAEASREPRQAVVGNTFRMSRPVILGEGHAKSPRCAECHAAMMNIGQGEVIGGYSAAVDLSSALAVWRSSTARWVFEASAMLAVTLAAIYALLRFGALRPLERLSRVTQTLAAGSTDVNIDLGERPDALGSMARSLGIFRDSLVAKRELEVRNEQAQSELRYLASHDTLTGLPNRALFAEKLDRAMLDMKAAGGQLAVLCIDVDHFKTVNDELGHAVGDRFLQIVADRLRAAIGKRGFAARLGGDEFALVMINAGGAEDIEELCRSLLLVADGQVEIDDHRMPLTLSLGVAVAPTDGTGADILLRHADTALYRSKAEGRHTYRFFDADMNAALTDRRVIERDLRIAFERGDLSLHYQPLVDVGSGRIVAVEALMRWNHAERGWISPSVFIPIAETCGLIGPMGRWLIRTACEQATNWPGVGLSLNVSPAQFRDRDLAAFIAATLETTGFPADRLEVEITEGLLIDNTHKPLETLLAIKALGVRIAMDDFGTGYSSLGYLQSFPFDKIKIDRSFVSSLEDDANAAAIVRTVVGLGRSLGMVTTAEGVETEGQLQFLREQGCSQVQGYLLAKPLDPLRLTSLLASWVDHHQAALSEAIVPRHVAS